MFTRPSSCFNPSSSADDPAMPPPSPLHPHDNTNLTTCLYHTHLGIFSFTWSTTLFSRSHHLKLHAHSSFDFSPSSSTLSLHLHMKDFFFWKKRGSKNLSTSRSNVLLFWDLSRAKFRPGPDPVSGFYIAIVVDGELRLLVGDLLKLACVRTRARMPERSASQAPFPSRVHVLGNRVYNTTARIEERNRDISVDCNVNGGGKLSFCVDKKRVLQVKRLKWKFRGNGRVEFNGVSFQVSWDVYIWLFEDGSNGYAVFMFRFDKRSNAEGEDQRLQEERDKDKDDAFTSSHNMRTCASWSFGMHEIELRKIRNSMPRAARIASSSSMSSSESSIGSNSSVMEWASTEENDLTGPVGFSLLVYAWKRR